MGKAGAILFLSYNIPLARSICSSTDDAKERDPSRTLMGKAGARDAGPVARPPAAFVCRGCGRRRRGGSGGWDAPRPVTPRSPSRPGPPRGSRSCAGGSLWLWTAAVKGSVRKPRPAPSPAFGTDRPPTAPAAVAVGGRLPRSAGGLPCRPLIFSFVGRDGSVPRCWGALTDPPPSSQDPESSPVCST